MIIQKNQDTCYIDRCEDDPCNEGQECTWGWNDDEKSSWFLCDGEGERFFHIKFYISFRLRYEANDILHILLIHCRHYQIKNTF